MKLEKNRLETNDLISNTYFSNEENLKNFIALKNGDLSKREILIKENSRLVPYVLNRYFNQYILDDDLIMIGMTGLIEAVDKFDCERGFTFATYATISIKNRIINYLNKNIKKTYLNVSIFTPQTKDEDCEYTLEDIVSSLDESITEYYEKKEVLERIYSLIKLLPQYNQTVIIYYFGLNGKSYTVREIAKILDKSEESVSQKIVRSINFIQWVLIKDGYVISKEVIRKNGYSDKKKKSLLKK